MTPKSNRNVIAAVAAAVLAVAAVPVLAQGWGGGPGMGMGMGRGMGNPDAPWRARFEQMDENHDGVVDKEELRAYASGVFGAMDADDDGRITLDEYKSVRMGPQNGRNPERQAAMQERKVARFSPMDTDHDGVVSRDEFLAWHADVLFARMDRNHDGKVTPTEFRGHGW